MTVYFLSPASLSVDGTLHRPLGWWSVWALDKPWCPELSFTLNDNYNWCVSLPANTACVCVPEFHLFQTCLFWSSSCVIFSNNSVRRAWHLTVCICLRERGTKCACCSFSSAATHTGAYTRLQATIGVTLKQIWRPSRIQFLTKANSTLNAT